MSCPYCGYEGSLRPTLQGSVSLGFQISSLGLLGGSWVVISYISGRTIVTA